MWLNIFPDFKCHLTFTLDNTCTCTLYVRYSKLHVPYIIILSMMDMFWDLCLKQNIIICNKFPSSLKLKIPLRNVTTCTCIVVLRALRLKQKIVEQKFHTVDGDATNYFNNHLLNYLYRLKKLIQKTTG